MVQCEEEQNTDPVETPHPDSNALVSLHLYVLSFVIFQGTSLLFTQRLLNYLWNMAGFYRPAASSFIRMRFALLNFTPLPG